MRTIVFLVAALAMGQAGAASLLIGNTSGDNVVKVNTAAGTIKEFIAAGSGGLSSPDDFSYGPDGKLYVSSGSNTSGAILRFDPVTGAFIDVFATSPGLLRPYGHAFGPDGRLYVSSFRSDEILRYDATTGAFIDVFASGSGTPDGLNGPNDLLFGPDGKLYVSTQGSVARRDGTGEIDFTRESQILRYDIATGGGEVFAPQPTPTPGSFGFVSFLGLTVGPDGKLWTSDFANGLRVYDFADGSLDFLFGTNYTSEPTSSNFIGSLAFVDGVLFVPGFNTAAPNDGSLLVYELFAAAGQPPATAVLFPDDPLLQRPIGIIAAVPLPPALWLLGGAMVFLGFRRRPAPLA